MTAEALFYSSSQSTCYSFLNSDESGLMSLIVSLIIMTVLAAALRAPLKRFPLLVYGLAIAVSITGIFFTLYPNPNGFVRAFAYALQKGHMGFSLFAVVMYIGVLSTDSAVRRFFNPVRAELSIVAAILIAGHFCLYVRNYLFTLDSIFSLKINILIALIFSFLLLILLIALTITSFNAVKRRMKPRVWKSLQQLAYPFFALIYLHLLGYLLPAALSGSTTALINVSVYTVIFCAYAALRIRKAVLDKRILESKAQDCKAQA